MGELKEKCEECGCKEFRVYNYGLITCVSCGNFKDIRNQLADKTIANKCIEIAFEVQDESLDSEIDDVITAIENNFNLGGDIMEDIHDFIATSDQCQSFCKLCGENINNQIHEDKKRQREACARFVENNKKDTIK